MSDTIEQLVQFRGGPHNMQTARVTLPRPFSPGATVTVGGEEYVVNDGPIAQWVKQKQAPATFGVLVLAHRLAIGNDAKGVPRDR
jgi:hypothetical protein